MKLLNIPSAIKKLSKNIEGELESNNINGMKASAYSCPVANYLRNKCDPNGLKLKVAITTSKSTKRGLVANIHYKTGIDRDIKLPRNVITWIREFDQGRHPKFN